MASELEAGIGIEMHFCRLANLHVCQVGFLEVGFDIAGAIPDKRKDGQPLNDLLAKLQAIGLSDAPGRRRAHFGPAEG